MDDPQISGTPKLLHQRKVALSRYITREEIERTSPMPPYVFATLALSVAELHMADRLRYELRAYVLEDHLVNARQQASMTFPSSWWQHWKQDHQAAWYGRWLVRRWPVKSATYVTTVVFDRYATYPAATINPPDCVGSPVVYESVDIGPWIGPSEEQHSD